MRRVPIFFSVILFFLCAGPVHAEEPNDGYTINYNTVSIIEYIRFASKICNTNFIYNKDELNFNVSVISDAPITPENVMATLLQVLRIHGLMLLEQGNNLVIHQSPDVKQIATLVTDKTMESSAPIVTRVFRVQYAKVDSLAAIIRPMISSEALLEISPETRQLIITDITANIAKIGTLIEILDSPHTPLEIKKYEASNNKIEFLIDTTHQIMTPLAQGNPFILVPQPLSGAVFIVSTPDLVEKALSIFQTIDTPPKEGLSNLKKITPDNLLIYNVQHKSGVDILSALHSIASMVTKTGVSEGDLIQTIDTAKFISQTNAIMFIGSSYSLAKVKEFLASLDIPSPSHPVESFFLYKPRHQDAGDIEKAVLEISHNLKNSKDINPTLLESLRSIKLNPLTNSLLFSGDPSSFPQIQTLLATIDIPQPSNAEGTNSSFIIYKIQHAPHSAVESALKSLSCHLDKSNPTEQGLITAIHNMKYIAETNSILFTGSDKALRKLQDLVPSFDNNISFPPVTNQLFIYKAKYQSEEDLFQSLREVIDDLKKNRFTDPSFLQSLQTMKWIKMNGSFLFTGDATSIQKIEELIGTLDVAQEINLIQPNYFIYKLQHTSADIIEEDLDNLVKSFKASGVKDTKLIHAIENICHVKETNSFLITGDPQTLEEVKQLVAEYDYPRASAKAAQSNFFMYKPQHVPAKQIEQSLQEVAINLKSSHLADPNLLIAIGSLKYIDATNSLLFTGTSEALDKVQVLIKDVDIIQNTNHGVQHLGKTSFFFYKIKHGHSAKILSSIKALSKDLQKSGASDKEFIATLQTAKYIRETNSILFTGPEESLQKIEPFVSQFDVPGSAPPPVSEENQISATNFFVYKPTALKGPELEAITHDFAENLKMSGLVDPSLFHAIQSMRWVEQSQSLVFTGSPKALEEIKQLVTSFDVAANAPAGSERPLTPTAQTIHEIDNINFLVYKLQFHKGNEIQTALRQIAKDLITNGTAINTNLLTAINTIQWIQITNSLLCSGDSETLSRLRDLIKSLDIPLKQVFIEMLVIETNLLNALEFGLEWGGKYKYRDKFTGSFNNITPSATGGTCNIPAALTTLNNTIPTIPMSPTIAQNIPFGCGFDLGIIGQVIKHNGATFLSLGSLLSALQTDDETSVILTPKIITQDGRTSTIFVGNNVPFVGSFVNTNGQNTVQTSNIEYRDVGLSLTITPVLGNSDIVTLDINLDRSQTVTDITNSSINFSNTSANGIITSKTTMQTTVHVPDKNFLILSGFINNSNVKSTSGIPCLGGLPLIGAAFSKDNNTLNNQNIVIFLRPHIINSLEDLRRITEDQEDAFRDQQGTPFLIHQFDDAMELIKSIDDN